MRLGFVQIHFVFYDTALYKCGTLSVSGPQSQQELALPPRPGPYEAVPQLYAAGPPSSVTLRFLRGHCAVLTRELHHQQAYNQFNLHTCPNDLNS